MQAIVQHKYGAPAAVLQLQEIDKPVAGDNEVLLRVRAASMHADVWHVVTGRPYILRLMGGGFFKPKNRVPGTDLAGQVEAVGKNVTQFRPGDAVFGESVRGIQWTNGGAFAEYATVSQDTLALKPEGVSFEQAAAVPTSGLIVLLNLQHERTIKPGQHVLINGAAGGVGAIALQFAKACGAHVTAVDATEKLAVLHTLGADHVIDYTQQDFTQLGHRYDLIFDVASNLSFSDCKKVLTPKGIYVLIGHDHYGAGAGRVLGSIPRFLKLAIQAPFVDHLSGLFSSPPDKKLSLAVLKTLLDTGKLTPVIDKIFPLSAVPEALAYLQSGKACGRIIITP
ncbi:MAG: NAD(P)-dependent alcohol dehydrogenase [Pseudomonadota bacterium]